MDRRPPHASTKSAAHHYRRLCTRPSLTLTYFPCPPQGTKCLLKQELARLPVLGWSWWFLEYTFLSRNWEKDRLKLERSIGRLRDFPIPYWVGAGSQSCGVFSLFLSRCKRGYLLRGHL